MINICAECGNPFEYNGPHHKIYCSPRCQKDANNRCARWRHKLKTKEAEETKKKNRSVYDIELEGRRSGGNYGTVQAQETLAAMKIDRKKRIEEIRKSWANG